MGELSKISFIVVNYKSEQCLENCVVSIQRFLKDTQKKEILVINNDSQEKLKDFAQKFPQVSVITMPTNIGFSRAGNKGSGLAKGEILFFINPDAEILEGKLEEIENCLNQNKSGIVGVKLVDKEGILQKWSFGESINPVNLLLNKLPPFFRSGEAKNKTKKVGWVSGGGLAIKKELFHKLGGFDENFFMYFEDVDLARRTKKMGYDVIWNPNILIKHLGGVSSQTEKEKKEKYYQSQEYYFRKHFGKDVSTWVSFFRKRFN